jgi:hypothetical protein
MSAKKKNKILVIIIFVIAFCWGLFFTHGFSFFWEDFDYYHLDKEVYPASQRISPTAWQEISRISSGYCKEFFKVERLFRIGFGADGHDRPNQPLLWSSLTLIFKDNVLLYRIFKAIIFALNASIIFLIINRVSLILGLFAFFIYLSSAEIWVSLVYSQDAGLYAQCGVILSIFIFLKLIGKKQLRYTDTLFYYIPILILSNFSVLLKGDGRYLAAVFFLTLLFFDRKNLPFHLPMLFLLALFELPVLGFLKKAFVDRNFSPIDIASHNPVPISESLKLIFKNKIYPINALGKFIILLFAVSVLARILIAFSRKLGSRDYLTSSETKQGNLMRLYLCGLWFMATFLMSALSRNFAYDGLRSFQINDLGYIIAPGIIFLSYFIYLTFINLRQPYSAIYLFIATILLTSQLLFVNLLRLSSYRGGWGNYFCAWHNAEKYIDETTDNALVIALPEMHYIPFAFRRSNNIVEIPPVTECDLRYIESKFIDGKYQDIFVVVSVRDGLKFKGKSKRVILKGLKVVDGDSGDLFDRLKRVIDIPSQPSIYVYHFKFN